MTEALLKNWVSAAPPGRMSKGDAVSGGGAGGLPPANFRGAFGARQNLFARPINFTENSGEPDCNSQNALGQHIAKTWMAFLKSGEQLSKSGEAFPNRGNAQKIGGTPA
jgi:hypothetical protein